MKRIQSKKLKTETYKINKISLSCFDDDGIQTLAYFHKDLRKQILSDDHKDSQRLS